MSLNSIFQFFVPKDKKFFPLFEEATKNLVHLAETLHEGVNAPKSQREEYFRKVEELEAVIEEIAHKTNMELSRNFITPFDREDIHALISAIDDVADYMWGSAKRIINYQLDEVDEVMKQFAVIITQCVDRLHTGIHELRNMKNIRAITDSCVAINSFENEADDLFDKATVQLFSSPNLSPIELIKRKDLYQEMEIVTDKCEDAANVIESIIIKYA